jgi:hypothetical protein
VGERVEQKCNHEREREAINRMARTTHRFVQELGDCLSCAGTSHAILAEEPIKEQVEHDSCAARAHQLQKLLLRTSGSCRVRERRYEVAKAVVVGASVISGGHCRYR